MQNNLFLKGSNYTPSAESHIECFKSSHSPQDVLVHRRRHSLIDANFTSQRQRGHIVESVD